MKLILEKNVDNDVNLSFLKNMKDSCMFKIIYFYVNIMSNQNLKFMKIFSC